MQQTIKGKYQIVREIARSNDIVYEAVDTTFGRKIALKELNISAGVTGQARRERIERFNREARAAGRLSHPNIVSVFDYGEENGRYFIAMEFLEGQSLRDAMQVRMVYPLKEAMQIICQILDALAYAHANRVVHRDIKPDNIHILPGGQAKLTDFGIARLGEEPALTSDGQVFGTPSYMSPEQIEGKNVDFHTDLFSTGVLLYEMLAGRKPFLGDSVISITYAIMHAEPPPINGIPQGIEQVIRRALSKQAHLRQSSAEQMKLDLLAAEQTPAIFLNSGPQTTFQGQTGYGYGAQGVGLPAGQVGYGNQASPQPGYIPISNYPAGGASQYGAGTVPSIPSMQVPANSAGNGGLPWSWNGQAAGQQGSAPLQPINGQSAQIPGLPGALPYASPPFQALPSKPLIVLSPAARTVLIAFVAAVILGTLIAVGIIATQNSYERYQQDATSGLIRKGADAYNAGDYDTAIATMQQAAGTGPTTEQRKVIETDLAYACFMRARKEHSAGSNEQARADYELALKAAPDYALAHKELADLLQEMGDKQGAQQHRDAATGGSSGPDSGTAQPPAQLKLTLPPPDPYANQDPNQFVNDQRAQARQLIKEGDQLSSNGNTAAAREKWQAALIKGAGGPEADEANNRLYNNGNNDPAVGGNGVN